MKKLTKSTLSLMLVLCTLLLSFTACKTPDREDPLVGFGDKKVFSFDAKSLEEMKEMFSNDEIQPKHENDIFEKAIYSEKLIFDKYIIEQIKYMPIQNGNEEFTGDVTLSILWNEREPDENFYEFGWDFCYYKDGYNKTVFDTPNQLPDNSSVYYYDIDEYYRCSYTIINEVVNKDEISNQLLELCRDIEAMLQGKLAAEDIKEGMKLSEIVEILGKGTDVGSGAIIYEWKINDEQYLYVWFTHVTDSPDLIASSVEIRKERLHLAPVD
ncbi:MAG: hypothetical protein IIU77_06295 [Clostridia bacterium]|nr:hypothetical protein [Clostridia bacterium]